MLKGRYRRRRRRVLVLGQCRIGSGSSSTTEGLGMRMPQSLLRTLVLAAAPTPCEISAAVAAHGLPSVLISSALGFGLSRVLAESAGLNHAIDYSCHPGGVGQRGSWFDGSSQRCRLLRGLGRRNDNGCWWWHADIDSCHSGDGRKQASSVASSRGCGCCLRQELESRLLASVLGASPDKSCNCFRRCVLHTTAQRN
jgi:hypothetical protein